MEVQDPLLQKVAIRLFEVCPQSASVERVQSRGSHPHRNGLETVECHSTNIALSVCQSASLEQIDQ